MIENHSVQLFGNIFNGVVFRHLDVVCAADARDRKLNVAAVQPAHTISLAKGDCAVLRNIGGTEHGLRQTAAHDDLTVGAGLLGGEHKLLGGLGVAHLHAGFLVAVDVVEDFGQLGVLAVLAHGHAVNLKGIQVVALVVLADGGQLAQVHQVAQGLAGIQIGGGGLADAQGLAHIGGNAQVGAVLLDVEVQLELSVGAGVGDLDLLLKDLAHLCVHGLGVLIGQLILFDFFPVDLILIGIAVRTGNLLHLGQVDGLGGAVQGQAHGLAGEVFQVIFLPGQAVFQAAHAEGLDILVLIGLIQVQTQGLGHVSAGLGDIQGVAGSGFQVLEYDGAAAHHGLHPVLGVLALTVAEGNLLSLQLLVNQPGQHVGVGGARSQLCPNLLHGLLVGHLVKVDVQLLAAVDYGHAAVQGAQLGGTKQVDIRGGLDVLAVAAVQEAVAHPVLGGGGQLVHRVDGNVAAGLAAGGHLVLVQALGDHLYRVVEKAGGQQVGGGAVGGILVGKAHHFADDAPVCLLLPLRLGRLLVQGIDLGLVALYQIFDHALSVQAAGQTADYVAAVVQAAGHIAAAYSAKRRHKNRSFRVISVFPMIF